MCLSCNKFAGAAHLRAISSDAPTTAQLKGLQERPSFLKSMREGVSMRPSYLLAHQRNPAFKLTAYALMLLTSFGVCTCVSHSRPTCTLVQLSQAGMDKQSLEANLLAANDQEVQAQQCVVDKLSQELQHHEDACKDLEIRMEMLAKLKAFLDTAQDDHDDLDVSEATRAAAAQVLAKYKVQVEAEGNQHPAAQAAAQKLPTLFQDLESAKERLQVLAMRRAAARKLWKEFSACIEQHRQQRQ